jgi:hypothetical protein
MVLYNSGIKKRYLADGIIQDLFDDGTPTPCFTFPHPVWNIHKAQGFFDSPEGRYIFAGSNKKHHAIGAIHPGYIRISFWPIR